MSLIIQLIENCLSPDNIIRSKAEKDLLNCCDQNLFEILSQFSKFIADDSTPSKIRQFCGTFLKHIFSNEKYISKWYLFTPDQKNVIKNSLLGSLASENDETKRTCSMAIASLAKVEIPKGWNIIEIICNASGHQNINYKMTALITLQNIIDYLGNEKLKDDEIKKILLSLTTNMSTNMPTQIINQAIIGFTKIIPIIDKFFANEGERNFMINLLLELLEPNYINKVNLNESIQKNILICVTDIVKYYASYLQYSFSKIADMSFRYFTCNNQLLSTFAIELWCTICDEEEKNKKIIITSNYEDSLVDCILRVIQTREVNKNFEESDEWTPTKAVVILLSGLVYFGHKKILDKMLKFISECFSNELVIKFDQNLENLTPNEKIKALIIKENAYLIYRGILYSNNIDPDIIKSSLQKITNELKNDAIIPIGKSIALCLIVICNCQFSLINDSQKYFDNFMFEILYLLDKHINNKIILNCLCLILKHILGNAYPEYFNKHLTNILSILLKISYDKNSYNKDLNITSTSMFLIGKIIEICEDTDENKKIIQLFFSEIYSRFQQSLTQNYLDKERQICYQDCILTIIDSCSQFQKITMDANQMICLYNLIDQCLQQRGFLFEEAVSALGSLSFFGWDLFSNIYNNVIKYILFSLEERQNYQLCYQGLLASDDIISSVGQENISIIPQIVEKIKKILNDPNIPRGLKIKCFPLYHDIFLIQDPSIGDYLQDVIKLLVEGMNSSIEEPKEDIDLDTLEYLSELRAKIIELLTGVYSFLVGQNQVNVFSPYIDGFIKYLSKIVKPEYKPDESLIAEVCGVLADIYIQYRSAVELYFEWDSLDIIFKCLENSSNPKYCEIFRYGKQTLLDYYLRNKKTI